MSKSNPLERAFKLVDIVASAGREISLIEVVQTSGLPQSSTFRLLSNLVESGMVSFDAGNKTYTAGPRAVRLSLFISGQASLKEALAPTLKTLASRTKETCFFVAATETGNRLLDFALPNSGTSIFIHPGFEFPAHATAAGKVNHAFSSDAVLDLPENLQLPKYQPRTVTDKQELREMFREIRADGFAENESELDDDVYSICVPVFYRNSLAGALGIVGPSSRMLTNSDRSAELISTLKDAAAEVSTLVSSPKPGLSSEQTIQK
ncbi:MAG: IclR family transcriptional regulator [Paracoccaceae bacterium]|nr:IclR family transcriptional regulator [Paracoccaceae bacterium]